MLQHRHQCARWLISISFKSLKIYFYAQHNTHVHDTKTHIHTFDILFKLFFKKYGQFEKRKKKMRLAGINYTPKKNIIVSYYSPST